MKEREFINIIKDSGKGVFTISDISRLIEKDRKYSILYVGRLYKRGVLSRVERGKYVLSDTDIAVVATNLVTPSYLSFLSGLYYYHLTAQIPSSLQVVTTRSKRRILYEQGIDFIKFDKKRVFGYNRVKLSGGYAFIGEIEKIVVDILFMPRYCPLGEVLDALDNIDIEKVVDYGLKMKSIVTLKRLGYLLELKGFDVHDKLERHLNKRYDLLNPSLPPSGRNNRKWMLKLNEEL